MQTIVILGSTGSIGRSTLDVIRLHRETYQVFALSGQNNAELLFEQCCEFKPEYAYIGNPQLANDLRYKLKAMNLTTQVISDSNLLAEVAAHPSVDIVMSAIVGSAGLQPTYAAAVAGKRILLANKESLVAGGHLISQAVTQYNATLIPVDSEHSAIFQALPFGYSNLDAIGVNKIILTASGGPFLHLPYQELERVTASQAVKHPNWSMGQKISVDSSTLMNKGLEVIEAYWLFKARLEQIEVVIHPQSIIHSMVEYIDSSIIAQLGTPDMKTPIAYALAAPKRIDSGSSRLNFSQLNELTFTRPDFNRFPCLGLALEGLRLGGAAPAIINASNEIAVAKFLEGKHGFYAIPAMIEKALAHFNHQHLTAISEVMQLDHEVKSYCRGH